jgi:hypothetical protein
MKKFTFLFVLILFNLSVFAQYPPAAGQIGSTAIYKDSSVFIDWAVMCSITRGYINISDTSFEDPAYPGTNKASFGDSAAVYGIADNNTISLGDGGSAVLTFSHPISNGQGFDFAVFENSFDDTFLELAYVEVSSDGIHFVRFPSVSLTQTTSQIPGFGTLDATKIHNLAGKYKVFYGTPFDLNDLQDSTGINLNNITHIRIVDVIGSISENYLNYDSQGHIINDPFPTPFGMGGFDLDAVGVIHNTTNTGISDNISEKRIISIYPNPSSNYININTLNPGKYQIQLMDISAKVLKQLDFESNISFEVSDLQKGIYFIKGNDENGNTFSEKIIIY